MEETTYTGTVASEAKFDINELFFSITDHQSRILAGNDVFIRISGYAKEELIGQFHHIVRHPDMPKIVFKTFWDYLNAGKPIIAYVKNRAKNGDYYWVLAAVFPLKERYVSIRLKPSSALFPVVRELYSKLLVTENEKGVDESAKALDMELNALGYIDYDRFMVDALLQEMQGRQGLLAGRLFSPEISSDISGVQTHLKSVYEHMKTLTNLYDGWFEKIDAFIRTKTMFEEKSLFLREVARNIVFLSLNASVSSYKIASGGETFGILARDIRTNAKENDTLIGDIDAVVHSISESLNGIVFSVAGIRLQTEIFTCFIEERLSREGSSLNDENRSSMEILFTLVTQYVQESNVQQVQIEKRLQETLKYLELLERQMMYLGYVQVYGIIEAAAHQHETVSFEGIFSQLKTLITMTSGEVAAMQTMVERFYSENRRMMEASIETSNIIAQLNTVMADIRKSGSDRNDR